MQIRKANILGIPIDEYHAYGVVAQVYETPDWATIYFIQSLDPGKGNCQKMLLELKDIFKDKQFGCTAALTPRMKHILQKLDITEYE